MQSLESLPKFLKQISQDIQSAGGDSYLVGGWVRDSILGVDSKDYDVEVYRLEEAQLLKLLSQYGKPSSVGKSFGVYIMRVAGINYDFSFPRTETKIGEGHKGFEVQPDPHLTFEVASSRRDFTINAMGLNLFTGQIEDPQGGQIDLQAKVLRHVGPAFGEDPLRALRAIQFAARFDLQVPPDTIEICREQDLSELSTERFEEEFKKLLLKAHHIDVGLLFIREMHLLRFFPELDALIPTFESLDQTRGYSPSEFPLGAQINQASHYLNYFQDERDQLIFMYTILTMGLEDSLYKSFMARFTQDVKLLKGIESRRQAWGRYQAWIHSVECKDVGPGDASEFQAPSIPPGVIRRIALDCPIREFALILHLLGASVDELNDTDIAQALQQERWRSYLFKLQGLRPAMTTLVESSIQWHVFDDAPEAWFQGRDLIAMGYRPGPQFGQSLKQCFEKQLDEEFIDRSSAEAWLKAQF